jgi:hypothetical protein
MNVIDQILSEWSYRCDDGIVDLNNPKKVKVLFEIIKPLLTEDIDDEILNALIGSNSNTKEKVLKFLKRVGDTTSNESLEQKVEAQLKPKLRQDIIEQVIFTADSKQYDILEEIHEYLKNPKVSYDDLLNNDNLNSLFSNTGFSDDFINKMISIKGSAQPAVGKGEVAIILFVKDAVKASKGDVLINGKEIEVKGSVAKVVGKDIEVGSKDFILAIPEFQNFSNKYKDNIVQNGGWLVRLYSGYSNVNNKQEYINDVISILQIIYPTVKNIKLESSDFSALNNLSKKIALFTSLDYLQDKDLLFINTSNNDYIYIKGYDDFASKVKDGTLSVGNPSDRIPRISYLS